MDGYVKCSSIISGFMDHKGALLKEVVDIPLTREDPTWLGARFRKVAAREALDMISSVKKRWSHQPEKITKPTHRGLSMRVSSTIAKLQEAKEASEFDLWLHLSSIGDGVILDLPIRKHPHFKEMLNRGKRLNAYVISESHVQFAFSLDPLEVDTPKTHAIGVDTGIKKLAALSDGSVLGEDVEKYVTRITAAIDAGASQMRARRAMRHYMDGVANQLVARNPSTVVVEDLVNLKNGTKKRKRVNKSVRRKLGAWAYSYWLTRLEMTCERHRVPFVRVDPAYTSQMCNSCKHTERSNRKGELFQCLSCGFEYVFSSVDVCIRKGTVAPSKALRAKQRARPCWMPEQSSLKKARVRPIPSRFPNPIHATLPHGICRAIFVPVKGTVASKLYECEFAHDLELLAEFTLEATHALTYDTEWQPYYMGGDTSQSEE